MKTTHRVWIFFDLKKNMESKPLTLTQAQIFILNLAIKDFDQYLLWTPGWVQWTPLSVFLDSEQNVFTSMKAPKPKNLQVKKTPTVDFETTDVSKKTVRTRGKKVRRKKTSKNVLEAFLNAEEANTDISMTMEGNSDSIFEKSENCLTTDVETNAPRTPDYGYYFHDFSIHDVKRLARTKNAEKVLTTELEDRRYERANMRIEVILISAKGVSFRTHSQNVSLGGTLLEDQVPVEYAKNPFDIVFINKFESSERHSRLLLRCKVVGDFTRPQRLVFVSPNKDTLMKLEEFITAYKNHARRTTKAVS